ncbi:WD repeat-containing protein [Candidatus Magnetobacterium bavaricum]|uniref:WD repeat-containing protein n=1 Tax=Candidatus Magnetobacterium bavaricum TaxID=29290 RepID=A0A0F3H1J2_9BACT|nr:WD repeat-containing protein [Candidatus Magnetobacterium bavaricum]
MSLKNAGKKARCKKCGKGFVIRRIGDRATGDRATRLPGQWITGDVIMDLYEVTGILGEGGMGTVYKVHHRGWNVDLAVKSPKLAKPKTTNEPDKSIATMPEKSVSTTHGKSVGTAIDKPGESKKMPGTISFEQEAETWVNLGLHPNIVSCYYVREIDGIPRVFAEYIEGGSLNDWIADGKLTDLDKMIDIAIQFAWGLQYSHDKGLIHQDVKPANLMMTTNGIAKVTDFGLAKAMSGLEEGIDANFTISSVKSTGGMTPAYCSPEQANRDRLTIKTDIWSWAVSILVMFIGEVTWPSGTIAGEVLKMYIDEGKSRDDLPSMPPSIAELLSRCFEEDIFKRPDSMAEIAQKLMIIYKEVIGMDYMRQTPVISKATADSLNNRAVSLLDLGRHDEAQRLWMEAVKLEPHHPESTYNLGLFKWRNAKMSDNNLIKEMEEVQRSHKDDWRGSYLLAQVHLERDDCASAIAVLSGVGDVYLQRDDVRAAYTEAETRLGNSKRLLSTLNEHDGAVTCVCLNKDGSRGLSAGQDSTLRLWDTKSGESLQVFFGHIGAVTAAYLTPDARYVISGGVDKTVRVWDASTGYCLHTLKGHNATVMSVHIDKDAKHPLSGSGDGTTIMWDLASGHFFRSFGGHKGGVCSVITGITAEYVFSAGKDGTIKLWEVDTLRCIHTFRGHAGSVNSISISQDGESMISGGSDKTILLWDIPSKECLNTLSEHVDTVTSVVLSWGGRTALSASADKTVKQWDVSTGRCMRTFESDNEGISSVYMSQDGKLAISGSYEGAIHIWQIGSDGPPYHAPMMLSQVLKSETAFSAMVTYGKELASAHKAQVVGDFVKTAIHIHNARQQKGYSRASEAMNIWKGLYTRFPRIELNGAWEGATFKEHEGAVNSISIDDRGRYLLSACADGTLKFWDIEQGYCIRTFKAHMGSVLCAVLSPDGELALSAGADAMIRLWETSREREKRLFRGHTGPVRGVGISYDGRLVISCGNDATIRVWDIKTGKELKKFAGHDGQVNSISLAMDGRFAVSGSADNKINRWEIAGFMKSLNTYQGHSGNVTSVGMSHDGKIAVSGSEDKTVKIWDISIGQCKQTLYGHTAPVTCVYITLDNAYILSGSMDNTVRLWNTKSGLCMRVFQGHLHAIQSVSMSRDGRIAASAGEDGSIKLWILDWELDVKQAKDWDPATNSYLDIFLTNHTPYIDKLTRRGQPVWNNNDLEDLLFMLGCAGYGYLSAGTVNAELNKMVKQKMKKN